MQKGERSHGSDLFPSGGRLRKATEKKIFQRLNCQNLASYSGLVRMHKNAKKIRQFHWFDVSLQDGKDSCA